MSEYKRVHQTALRFILDGKLDVTENYLQGFLKTHPNDAETLYMLGVLEAKRGNIKEAEAYLKRAVEAGLPLGRLVAGPRELLQPLRQTLLLKQTFAEFQHQPVHGPLVGHVTDSAVSVWVRTAKASKLTLHLRDAGAGKPVATSAKSDFTAVATIDGLKPATRYEYAIQIDDGPITFKPGQSVTTFKPGAMKFKIAFGGGAGYVPPNERMWTTIGKTHPDALLLLGDNVYIDDPESPTMQRYTYQRRQSRPEWRALTATTPTYTIWDDHDFSTDDSWGGPKTNVPFWKTEYVDPIFQENWANPAFSRKEPGCWYDFTIGDVHFIMLDCRFYRTKPGQPDSTMLGPKQMIWLKETLSQSTGTFKVLCSSVPWDYRTKGDSTDTWNGYRNERTDIFNFLAEKKIEGVVLMSADRHRSDAWKVSRANAYDFYEFSSSRLTNQHVHPRMEKAGAIFSYNAEQSFGLVEFDTTLDDPTVTYTVVNIDGKKPHTLTVKRGELK